MGEVVDRHGPHFDAPQAHPGPSKRAGRVTRSDWSAMRSDWNREATIEELLSDPMMEAVLRYARTTPKQLRALMREVAAHRGKVGTDKDGENAI